MWSALGAGASVNAKGHWPKMLARPNWSVRVSFASLADDVCDDIGRAVRAVARSYVDTFQALQKKQR